MCMFFPDFAITLRARKPKKAQTKLVNITGLQYFRAYQQVGSTLSFILYPLFILLPHYLRQLSSSPCSAGRDTDAVAVIAIACLFRRVGHRRCHRRRSCIQYAGGGAASFVGRSSTGDGSIVWSRPLPFRQGWDTAVSF